jgi:hypothetical protein
MTTFTVPTDQSSVEKIALADYMTRQQVISRPEGGSDIQMQLERKMARVIVRISGFGSQYDDDEKTVSNVSIYSEASGIADGNPTGSSTEIQPYAQGDGGQGSTYTALVVPGYGDSGARFIRLTDGEYSTLLVKGIPELEAGNSYTFNSAYRTIAQQKEILEDRSEEHMEGGLPYAAAYAKARETVALPGTSEHHLGLAVDLLGDEAIAWLTEHCWEYGFIVRYQGDKAHITGIIDEPWHFRYVGVDVALDMKDSGLCLEEYLGAVPIETPAESDAPTEPQE